MAYRTRTRAEVRELHPRPTRAPTLDVDAWPAAITKDIAWYDEWPISDDVGTEFWFTGSPRRSHERLEDFAIERHPAPPPTATTLIIGTPAGDEIRVDLTS